MRAVRGVSVRPLGALSVQSVAKRPPTMASAPAMTVPTTLIDESDAAPEPWPLNGTYGLLDCEGAAERGPLPVPPPVRFAPLGCIVYQHRASMLDMGSTYADGTRVVDERAGRRRANALRADGIPEGRRAVRGHCGVSMTTSFSHFGRKYDEDYVTHVCTESGARRC